MTECHTRFEICPTSPFAFGLALDYLRTSPSTIIETIAENSYRRPIRLNGKTVLLTVRGCSSGGVTREQSERASALVHRQAAAAHQTGTPSATVLEVELAGTALDQSDRIAAAAIVRHTFATDVDLTPLDEVARADPVFGTLVHSYAGLRPVVIPDLFETIVWAIVGQQINVQFAAKCKRALVERFGPRVEVAGQVFRLFPAPAELAQVAESDLAALQFSRQKIRYTLNLAREIVNGRLNLDDLRSMPYDEAQARLESILGVGRWTAEYVLMRGLGHRDVIPAADGGLRRIIGQSYGLGRHASESEVRELAAKWAGWRSFAAFYWWFTLQQQTRQTRESKDKRNFV